MCVVIRYGVLNSRLHSKTGLGLGFSRYLERSILRRHMVLEKELFLSTIPGVARHKSQPMRYIVVWVTAGNWYEVLKLMYWSPWFCVNKPHWNKDTHKVWDLTRCHESNFVFPLSNLFESDTDWGMPKISYYMNYQDTNGQPMPLNTRLTNKCGRQLGAGLDFVTVYDMDPNGIYFLPIQHHQGFSLEERLWS